MAAYGWGAQMAALRQLLSEESERCAAARAEVLAVSLAAGNERLALQAELATARRKVSAATAEIARNEQSGIHADPHFQQFACEFRNDDAAQDGFRAINSAAGMVCLGDGNVEGGRRIGDGQTE